jgi:hypothetical protein
MANGVANVENSFSKVTLALPPEPATLPLCACLRKMKAYGHASLLADVHDGVIYNSPKTETTQMSTNKRTRNKL